METQQQNASVLSASNVIALNTGYLENKNPVPTFLGNSNMPSYNKANHADSPLARLSGVGRRYAAKKRGSAYNF